jgi:hypothetical protein
VSAYIFEIIEHTHVIFCAVSLVELFQAAAGVFAAFAGTVFQTEIAANLACYDNAAHALIRFMVVGTEARVAAVFLALIGHAERTVHPAWGNHLHSNGFVGFHFSLLSL